jgi:sulfur transfer complex TusBCD TusB component (DsrH family)
MNHNTLHLCNYSALRNIEQYQSYISDGDSVVFYAKLMSDEQHQFLINFFQNIQLYFLINEDKDKLSNITYADWVDLVTNYKKTFTWK